MTGSMARGTPMALRISSSQSSVLRFISMVRLALVTSVRCTPPAGPPVRFQISHESTLPKSSSPFFARARAPGTLSSIHRILGPEKYVANGKPTLRRKRSCPPVRASLLHRSAVRVSCHTMALYTGWPVTRSHTTVVSRWLVMPTAARSGAARPPLLSAPAITSCVRAQISSGLCSTQPGRGKICWCSF